MQKNFNFTSKYFSVQDSSFARKFTLETTLIDELECLKNNFLALPQKLLLLSGKKGCGRKSLAKLLWTKMPIRTSPLLIASSEKIKSKGDLLRLCHKALKGGLLLEKIELLDTKLLSILSAFCFAYKLNLIASCQEDKEATKILHGLFPLRFTLPEFSTRKKDIQQLISKFLEKHKNEFCLDQQALQKILDSFSWQAGKEELLNFLFQMRSYALKHSRKNLGCFELDEIKKELSLHSPHHLLHHFLDQQNLLYSVKKIGLKKTLRSLEASLISQVDQETCGCLSQTAKILALPLNTLASRKKVLEDELDEVSSFLY